MKLFLYAGGDAKENRAMDLRLMSMCGISSPRMAYVPYSYYESEVHFRDFVAQYRPYGVERFLQFPVDVPVGQALKHEAFSCEVIHLSGGNTFYFLNSLRKSGLIGEFKRFVSRGGILTGLSAGAILMTPDIHTASFPKFDRDDNDEGIKNLKALGLVNFHFFPHYRNSRRYDDELRRFSRRAKGPLYACPDGTGIVVTDNEVAFVGKIFAFVRGHKFDVS
jgi:dipeptidase E